jgi:signal transduction histidine kinase/ActR/RegA family two-component response regulator
MVRVLASFVVACVLGSLLRAEESPAANPRFTGSPLTRVWLPQDYGAAPENNCFLQDPRTGFLYVGNKLGVLEFDGVRWRLIPTQKKDAVFSLALDGRGRIWACGENGIALLVPDARGELQAVSQLERLPEPLSSQINTVIKGPGGVYFRDAVRVAFFPDDDRTPRVWKLAGGPVVIVSAWEMDGLPHFALGNSTVFRVRQGEMEPVSGWTGQVIASRRNPAGGYDLLLPDGLGHWDGGQMKLVAEPMGSDKARSALFLNDGRIAFGGNRGGVYVCDREGRLLQRIDRPRGVPANYIVGLGEDHEGGLWVATRFGVARVQLDSPYALHGPTQKLEGTTHSLARHRGVLYAAGSEGLWRREAGGDFTPVSGTALPLRDISSLGDALYLQGRQFRGLLPGAVQEATLLENRNYYGLVPLTGEAGWLVHGANEGLRWARFDAGKWTTFGPLQGIPGSPRTWCEYPAGVIWATGDAAVWRIDFRQGPALTAPARRFGPESGLAGPPARVFLLGPRLIALVDGKLFRFDDATERFVPEDTLTGLPPAISSSGIEQTHLSADGSLWLQFGPPSRELWHAQADASGLWRAERLPGPALRYLPSTTLFHDATQHTLWIGGHGALVSRDLDWQPSRETLAPVAVVRRVETDHGDLIIAAPGPTPAQPIRLTSSQTALRILFAAPTFVTDHTGLSHTRFRTKLDGLDDEWSAWSGEARRDFTNLPWRAFTFRVQAQDDEGRLGPEATLAFSILAPWWATRTAWIGYAALVLGALFGGLRLRLRALHQRAAALEVIVAQRTGELREAKTAADAANEAKSAFLANMSHELRTPLNAILGFGQVLRRAPELSTESRQRLEVIARNGDHLLQMINEILDLSKIEAGRLMLDPQPIPLRPLLNGVAEIFAQRAADKGLTFHSELAPTLPRYVNVDESKLRQVLINLLGNALKFTPRGSLRLRVAPYATANASTVRFEVIDTGVGIAETDLPHLFQAFHQGGDATQRTAGTGLGLAISQRIVELMGGRIAVESAPERGSRFWFDLELPGVPAPGGKLSTRQITGYAGSRRRLLVVDDAETNRAVLRGLLEPLGFVIAECATGTECLRRAVSERFDGVLLDLRLEAGVDGLDVARELRRQLAGAPLALIAVSASVFESDRQQAFDAGCDAFVPKPFSEENLLSALGRHLRLNWIYTAAPAAVAGEPLPAPLRMELRACVDRGDIETLRARLSETTTAHPECAAICAQLDALAGGYQFERLRKALDADAPT